MKGLCGTFVLIALLVAGSCPCLARERPKPAPAPAKPALFASIEQIARGKTFQDAHIRNVRFTLSPVKAGFQISF